MHVDDELSQFLPALTDEERSDLRKNILEDGCTDPVIYWKETGAIVDGNNRFDICQNEGIGCPSKARSFKDSTEAKRWILRRQFGRRNVPAVARVELVQQIEESKLKAEAEAREKSGKKSENNGRTDAQIAELADVSQSTVKRVNKVKADAIPSVLASAKAGEISAHKASQIADLPKEEQPKALQEAKTRKPKKRKTVGLDKGQVVREMKGLLSKIVKCLDARGKEGNHARCNKALNEFIRAWEEWK